MYFMSERIVNSGSQHGVRLAVLTGTAVDAIRQLLSRPLRIDETGSCKAVMQELAVLVEQNRQCP